MHINQDYPWWGWCWTYIFAVSIDTQLSQWNSVKSQLLNFFKFPLCAKRRYEIFLNPPPHLLPLEITQRVHGFLSPRKSKAILMKGYFVQCKHHGLPTKLIPHPPLQLLLKKKAYCNGLDKWNGAFLQSTFQSSLKPWKCLVSLHVLNTLPKIR